MNDYTEYDAIMKDLVDELNDLLTGGLSSERGDQLVSGSSTEERFITVTKRLKEMAQAPRPLTPSGSPQQAAPDNDLRGVSTPAQSALGRRPA